MRDTGVKERLTSYITEAIENKSATYTDTGLAIYLGSNADYHVESLLYPDGGTDGVRFKINYSGTTSAGGIIAVGLVGGTLITSLGAEITISALTGAEMCHASFWIRTSTPGTVNVTWRKNTDVSTDTSLMPGSYLIARRL